MDEAGKGARQSAYQVCVGTDSVLLAQGKQGVWDSGKRSSGLSLISYGGNILKPFTRYFWGVRIWDASAKVSGFVISSFETGMMGMGNWQGTWISDRNDISFRPAACFRKSFPVNKRISTARIYIAAAGLYELYLNGSKIGDHRLDPMYTRFDRRNLYVSYDVTGYILNGENAIGVMLGNGWYNHQSGAVWNFDHAPWRARPAFCMDLRVTFADGTIATISSDGSWKTSAGSITSNSIYTGEHYDARLEQQGWKLADFDDSKWSGIVLRAAPSANIASQLMHPIRDVEEIPVQSMKKIDDSTYLFDLGRNIAGVSSIRVNGEAGTIIRLKHTERLDAKGRADMSNIDVYHRPKDSSDPFQTDIFILAGKGTEEFKAKFNYKGFQYVEVSCSKPVVLKKESLKGYFMHSDVPRSGSLNSSSPLINKIWQAANNTYLSNLFGYPTDCPQREKNGWTGDGHFAVESGLYNFDAITVYEKWLADHRDEQQPNGVLPDIIPTGGWGYGTANGTDWTSTIAIIPWNLYMFYGDSKPLSDCYPNIKRYVDYIARISPSGLTSFGRGDWVPVKSSSSLEYTSSVYYFVVTDILSKAAKLFGKENDYLYYNHLAEKIRTGINKKYFDPQKASYGNGVQTELSMALQWNIVPEGYRKAVAITLARRVARDGMHLDVGVLGAKAILNALSENGQAETAFALAAQDTYPSWGWWIANGATTLYENWDIDAQRDISENHMMFGEISAWFFKGLGGIRIDPQYPGFKNINLSPNFVLGLQHFEASHVGPYGKINSSWKRTGDQVIYTADIPANSTATLNLDLNADEGLFRNGVAVNQKGLKLGSGQHIFEVRKVSK